MGEINKEHTDVMLKIECADLSNSDAQPGSSQGPSTSSRMRYQLIPRFLPEKKKPWFNMGLDEITVVDLMTFTDWLKSGVHFMISRNPLRLFFNLKKAYPVDWAF